MGLIDSVNKTLDEIPPEANHAFIELKGEGDKDKQSIALLFEKKNDSWDIVASVGLDHIKDGDLDWNFKVNLKHYF